MYKLIGGTKLNPKLTSRTKKECWMMGQFLEVYASKFDIFLLNAAMHCECRFYDNVLFILDRNIVL